MTPELPVGLLARVPGVALGVVLSVWLTGPGCSGIPALSEASYHAGLAMRDAGHVESYQEAVHHFSKAIDLAGNEFFPLAHVERAECRLYLGRHASGPRPRAEYLGQALEDFRRVADSDPDDVELVVLSRALEGAGDVHLAQNQPLRAMQSFDSVLALSPSPAEDLDVALREYHLRARRQAGWIQLDAALALGARAKDRDDDGRAEELYLGAQEHFSLGLEIEPDDPLSNLGKGICLHKRGQSSVAMGFLERALAQPDPAVSNDPRGYFYLARAMEDLRGYQRQAIDYYRQAVLRDPDRSFLPLYTHLAAVLPVYVPPDDAEFPFFVRTILGYRGDEESFWRQVVAFGEELATNEQQDTAALGFEALAVAATRVGEIDQAVDSLVVLKAQPNFDALLDRVFPDQEPAAAAFAYGRAKVLFASGRHDDLEDWFREGTVPDLEKIFSPGNHDPYLLATLSIRGQNLLRRWQGLTGAGQSPERSDLTDAREFLSNVLSLRESPDVRLALGEVHEALDAYDSALGVYAVLARDDPFHTTVHRHVLRLHKQYLVEGEGRTEAWELLKRYAGQDPDIRRYVAETSRAGREHLCAGCGRRGAATDRYCLECGRRLPAALDPGGL
ncbi:MAG: hypothetical protein O7J95_11065 [Planctomycetota bacterium]|nr:hypothetical protein [Planctomycetota bacterium]